MPSVATHTLSPALSAEAIAWRVTSMAPFHESTWRQMGRRRTMLAAAQQGEIRELQQAVSAQQQRDP